MRCLSLRLPSAGFSMLQIMPLLPADPAAAAGKLPGPGATRGAAGPTAAVVAAGGQAGVVIQECVMMRDELLQAGERTAKHTVPCHACLACASTYKLLLNMILL